MNEIKKAIKDSIRQEIRLAKFPNKVEISEEVLDCSVKLALSTHLNTIINYAVCEYFLLIGNELDSVKIYNKMYRKVLKELL